DDDGLRELRRGDGVGREVLLRVRQADDGELRKVQRGAGGRREILRGVRQPGVIAVRKALRGIHFGIFSGPGIILSKDDITPLQSGTDAIMLSVGKGSDNGSWLQR